jgi:hypothetical protein
MNQTLCRAGRTRHLWPARKLKLLVHESVGDRFEFGAGKSYFRFTKLTTFSYQARP